MRQRRTEKIVRKEDLQEAYVTGLMEDEHACNFFKTLSKAMMLNPRMHTSPLSFYVLRETLV